jgi:small subunit ribosomal protein S16
MLMIRLSRVGKKKYATYRIVIQEKTKDPWGKALEFLGNYNPHTKELNVKKERIEYWRSKGAQMSATINNLLLKNEIIEGSKMKAAKFNKKKKKGEEKTEDKPKEEKKEEPKSEEKVAEVKEEKKEEKTEEPKEEVKQEEKKESTSDPKEEGDPKADKSEEKKE